MTRPPAAGRSWLVALAFGAAVAALDQITKAWALDALGDGSVIDLFWTLRLRLARNTGASFSLGAGLGPFIALAAVAVVVLLLRNAHLAPDRLALGAMGLVVGGASGNLVDRAFRSEGGFLDGAVIDFIDPQWWPVFNVADAAIVVGVGLLMLTLWRSEPAGES